MNNQFQITVQSVPDISKAYNPGLQALGSYASYVKTKDTRNIEGSVDIDSAVQHLYPDSNRWDYVVSYGGCAYYIEVHPATDGEVKKVIAKRDWLIGWLKSKAVKLNGYPSAKPMFYWIQSGKCGITKNSIEYKKAAMAGMLPKPVLSLGY